MLTGSFASSFHGVPRTTHDLDIVIDPNPATLRRFVGSLPPDEFYVDAGFALEAPEQRTLFNVIDLGSGWKADFIIIKGRPFGRVEFERRQLGTVMGTSGFITSPEDAVLSKLEWAAKSESERQLREVVGVLEVQQELDLEYLERLIEDLGLRSAWRKALELANE